jgi:hypothetical protein
MNYNNSNTNITVGKYLVSPIIRMLDNGWYATSVSIRSGSGQATTDRVLRLTRLCRSKVAAVEYAIGEGLAWIGAPRVPMMAASGAVA